MQPDGKGGGWSQKKTTAKSVTLFQYTPFTAVLNNDLSLGHCEVSLELPVSSAALSFQMWKLCAPQDLSTSSKYFNGSGLKPNLIGFVDRVLIWYRSRKVELISEEGGILFLWGAECFFWSLDVFHEEYLVFFLLSDAPPFYNKYLHFSDYLCSVYRW